MKKWIIPIILILVLPLVFGGLDMCDRKIGLNTNCTMLTPSLTGCATYNYTIYNTTGSLKIADNLSNLYGDIYQFNFTELEGDYIIELCDGSTREVRVTQEDESKMIIAIIIILPLIFGGLLLIGALTMNDQHNALKAFLFFISLISFWVSMHMGLISVVKFYDFPELQNLIGSTTYWTGLTFSVIVLYFLIYVFYMGITEAAQKRKEKLRY